MWRFAYGNVSNMLELLSQQLCEMTNWMEVVDPGWKWANARKVAASNQNPWTVDTQLKSLHSMSWNYDCGGFDFETVPKYDHQPEKVTKHILLLFLLLSLAREWFNKVDWRPLQNSTCFSPLSISIFLKPFPVYLQMGI